MDDNQFREKIRSALRGSFDTHADSVGLSGMKSMEEADPVPASGPGMQPQQQGAGVNQANVEKSVKGLFLNLGNVLKANNKIGTGVSIGLKDSDIQKMAKEVSQAIVKGDVNAFKKSISNNSDALNKKVLDFAKKQQATQPQQQTGSTPAPGQQPAAGTAPEGQAGQGPAQPMKAAEAPGQEMQSIEDEGTVVPNGQYSRFLNNSYELGEEENPISVGAMQGILKFATPTQVGDAIKALDSDNFAKFVSGLKKDAIDVLSKAVNNEGGGAGAGEQKPGGAAPSGTGGGDNNAEGNLKLGEL